MTGAQGPRRDIVLPDLGLKGLQGLQMLAGLGGGANPGGGRKGKARLVPLELRTNCSSFDCTARICEAEPGPAGLSGDSGADIGDAADIGAEGDTGAASDEAFASLAICVLIFMGSNFASRVLRSVSSCGT
mmetsp:Transcript_6887/g.11986  ORF Transcript_6887/g.11986 Transcript_6887/m.11986 type:complete len:131 (+) Transcript_6887:224-616(+)